MSAPPGQDPLNYEINLECATCGHAQFMHCSDPQDSCGCLSMRHALAPTIGSIGCTCTEFVRPDDDPDPIGVWWDHAHGGPDPVAS